MRGVMFGDKHTYWDWGLMLKSAPIISPPKPKLKYVDVPCSDGALDLSEVNSGQIQYENREIRFEFVCVAKRDTWADIYSAILDALHGKDMHIILDDDKDFFYTGRVTVGDLQPENNSVFILPMTANVLPYKVSKGELPMRYLLHRLFVPP